MRILHIVNDSATGGAQTLIENLCRSHGAQADIQILVLLGKDHLSDRFAAVSDVVHLNLERASMRVDVAVRKVSNSIRRFAPDIIHSHLLQSDLLSLLAKVPAHASRVSTVHTTGFSPSDRLRSRILPHVVARMSRGFEAVVACTTASADYMVDMNYSARKCVTIENGVAVPDTWHRLPIGGRSGHFVCLSRWHPMKDHRTLFQAYASLRRAYPAVSLSCAGSGMEASNPALCAMLEDVGLRRDVALLGPVDNVEHLLATSDASVISSAYGEALPMAGLESLVSGTPVIGTTIGSIPDLVADDRLLIPPSDVDKLSGALGAVIEMSNEEYQTLRHRSRTIGEHSFNAEVTASKYLNLYREVLAQ